jgi:DNA-binding CsgD family transcriptional regulator
VDTLELVGRQQELGFVTAALEDARSGRARSLALVGGPGIGKSALLDAAAATATGFTALRASGALSERDFPYAGLLALLRPLERELDSLPPAQRAALRAVLAADAGLEESFVVGAGALGALAAAAERSPVVVLVDDLQWLDDPTRDALAFVIRRLSADAVAVVLASRPEGLGDLGRVVTAVAEVAPLDDASAGALLARNAGAADPASTAALLAAAHGNPLALLELPRRLTRGQLAGTEPLPPALVAGELVERAFAASAALLPERTRVALATSALLDEAAVGELDAAVRELGASLDDLEPAEAEGLVSLAPGRIVFRHPLVRGAVLGAAGDATRRRVHRAIAGVLPSGERRALHLAEAAVGHDEEAATELAEAAAGLPPITAAALLARAAELHVDDARRAHTLCDAARAAYLSGRLEQAAELAHRAVALATAESDRGAALAVLGRVARITRPPAEAVELLLEAATLLEPHDRHATTTVLGEAFLASLPGGDPAVTLPLAERFLGLADRREPDERALASIVEGIALVQSGKGRDGDAVLLSVLETEAPRRNPELRVIAALWLEDHRRVLEEAELAIAAARGAGHLSELPRLLLFSAYAQARLGRFGAAYASASEAAETAEELGQPVVWCDCTNVLAGLEARLGLHDRCRQRAEQGIERSRSLDLEWYANHTAINLALSELAQGRAEQAVELLEAIRSANRAAGVADPGEYPLAELVEAYALLGRADLAAERLAELEELIQLVPRPFDRALATRCAALVAPDGEASELFERALELHDDEMPFEVAKTHLLFGERLRRMGERRRARAELTAAHAVFEQLGADWWQERCRRELAASGARLRRLDPETRDELTPQELQVALQVARGLSNREIAQALFLSPKTIEFHLTRIYRKLGLHARAELVERFRDQVE